MITTVHKIKIMQAHVDGQRIERTKKLSATWCECSDTSWNWYEYDYRVKVVVPPISREGLIHDIIDYICDTDNFRLAQCHRMVTGSNVTWDVENGFHEV